MNQVYNKKLVFIAACLAIFLFGVVLLSLGTIMPFITEKFGLDDYSKGILATILPFGILAGSLLFGPVADRYGYRYLLSSGVLIVLFCYLLITWTSSFLILSLIFFFLGTSGGILNGTANALISGLSEDSNENKAANLSLMGVFFGVGALGMPFVLALLAHHVPFHRMMTGAGIIMILPAAFFYFIPYPVSGTGNKISMANWFRLASAPLMLLIGMIGFFQSGMESLVNNWLTSYLTGFRGATGERSLFALTLFVGVFTFSRLVLGFVLRRIKQGIIIGLSMSLVMTGIVILLAIKEQEYYLLSLVLFGLGLAASFPVITGFAGDLFKEQPGTAISILFTLSLLGNMIINYLTGWVTGRFGYSSYPFIFMTVVIFTSLFFILFYRKYNKTNPTKT